MATIKLETVSLSYPIYSANSRSLRKSIIDLTTGGKIKSVNAHSVAVQALEDISLDLHDGDRLGLVGHNGAGKSTLLKVIAGIYPPTSGFLKVKGNIASLLNISLGMEEEATGYENIRIRGLLLGLNRKRINELIPSVEAFSELGNYLAMPVRTYSSGMRLRLAFAISTSIDPEILLLDEVIGVGDANFKEKAEARLNKIIDKANILVLACHDDNTIRDVCNKAILLEQGKIIAQGKVDHVLNKYRNKEVSSRKAAVAKVAV